MSPTQDKSMSNCPKKVISRIPLEDMRELWWWGPWKEPAPLGFSSEVLVICTSRAACLRYRNVQTHDYWLLDDDDIGETIEPAPPIQSDFEIFDEGANEGEGLGRRFKLLTFPQFVKEVQKMGKMMSWGGTLLVNPRHDKDSNFDADGIFEITDFLRNLACR